MKTRFEACRTAPLSSNARRYAENFIRSQGFDPRNLGSERLSLVFDALSRQEELTTPHKHNRHNWEPCFLDPQRQTDLHVPSLDLLIREWNREGVLDEIADAPPLWPGGKRFALLLTHDVDSVSGNTFWPRLRRLKVLGDTPGKERQLAVLGAAREILRAILPGHRYPELPLEIWLRAEQRYQFKSSFFFFADQPPAETWEDAFYRHGDRIVFEGSRRPVAEVMREIADRGWDVGLHGSSASSSDHHRLCHERRSIERAIGRSVATIRQHHLNFDVRYTPGCQTRAGFQADSTMGSNRALGFRCGTAFPFHPYDVALDRPVDILEVPMMIQDCVVFERLQLDEEMAYNQCRGLMDTVASVNGVLTLLWHNESESDSPAYRIYSRLLEYGASLGAWGCSLNDVNCWWRSREATLLRDMESERSSSSCIIRQ